jgi:adenine phosphoribosyltransferase
MSLENHLRVVPNFPKEGIDFLDISPLLENPESFQALIQELAKASQNFEFSKIVAIESRGFIMGSALAFHLNKGFVMVRKKGKLPGETVAQTYDLEYGTDTIEMLPTSLEKNEKVLLLDDVLATAGTAAATCELVSKLGATVSACLFFIELNFLNGRQKLPTPVHSLVRRK